MSAPIAAVLLLAASSLAQTKIADSEDPAVKSSPAGFMASGTAPTVVCDGKDGYRAELYGKEVLPDGKCLWLHEKLHIKDYLAICPDGCKGQKDGALAPYQTDPTPTPGMVQRCPKFKDFEFYWRWKIDSECRAYKLQYDCVEGLIKAGKKAKYDYFEKTAIPRATKGFAFWKSKGLTDAKPKLECKWEDDP